MNLVAINIDLLYFYFCRYICICDKKCLLLQMQINGLMINWNDKVKRLLKSELIKRGVSNAGLSLLLKEIGVHETKASIDSKISRGSFSAGFFLQCLSVIGCNKIEIEEYENTLSIAAEPTVEYKKSNNGK